MSYDIWQTEEPKGAPHTEKAFVFDGWSHEPLVIARKQDAQAAPQRAGVPVVATCSTASKVG